MKVCDLHCDSAQLWQAGSSLEDTSLHVSLPYLLDGGVGLQVFAAYVPPSLPKGVVGLNFHPAFLDYDYRKIAEKRCKAVFAKFDRGTEKAGSDAFRLGRAWRKFTEDYRRTMDSERIPLEKLLQHVDYLVDLAGEEVAAFGSDFDGIPDTPAAVEDCRGFKNILQGLRDRGYSESRLEKICWANFLRVLETVCG